MKLATKNNGSRDGTLMLVSRDLTRWISVADIAPTLQAALDDWARISPKLQSLSDALNDSHDGEVFDAKQCLSPLPRAHHWVDGSAYVNHVELVRKARGADMPKEFWIDPLVYQGGSDDFTPPHTPVVAPDESWGIDLEGEVAIITDDVPMGTTFDAAIKHIKLLMLVNDVSLRNLIPAELAKGFGFYQSKPATSFSPVAVTPDELGDAWRGAKVHLPLLVHINDKAFGVANAGVDMTFNFTQLIAHVTKTRRLGAGTILGSGTVSNKGTDGGPGKPVAQGGAGYSCIAEIRTIETIYEGVAKTPFLKHGDRVRIEMNTAQGQSVFGTIEQVIVKS
jgi:fumarylacetoacetate (FAA) hydrolase